MTDPTPTDCDRALAIDAAHRAVVEFMRDWNTMQPEACAWRMFHRLKTEFRAILSENEP